MKRFFPIIAVLAVLLLAACSGSASNEVALDENSLPIVTVFRAPT